MKRKKAEAVLRKFFIGSILFFMGFIALYTFYFDVTQDYDEFLNFTTPTEIGNLSKTINSSFYTSHDDSAGLLQSLQRKKGTQETGESATILNSFFGVLDFLGGTLKVFPEFVAAVASALKIPDYWWRGFIAIISLVLFIVVIGGFLRTPNW